MHPHRAGQSNGAVKADFTLGSDGHTAIT